MEYTLNDVGEGICFINATLVIPENEKFDDRYAECY